MEREAYLESIIMEAQELLNHIASGGAPANIAGVHLSLNALHSIFTNLCDVNARIREDIDG